MIEQDLQLSMPDGTADAVLFSPDASTPLPGVLHIPDIASIRATFSCSSISPSIEK